jgi:hypothetical protein
MSLANDYFEVASKMLVLEDKLFDAILEAVNIPNDWWQQPEYVLEFEDITYDYYDTSFELKETELNWELPPESRPKLHELGFSRCWVCYKDGSEKYYSLVPGVHEKDLI